MMLVLQELKDHVGFYQKSEEKLEVSQSALQAARHRARHRETMSKFKASGRSKKVRYVRIISHLLGKATVICKASPGRVAMWTGGMGAGLSQAFSSSLSTLYVLDIRHGTLGFDVGLRGFPQCRGSTLLSVFPFLSLEKKCFPMLVLLLNLKIRKHAFLPGLMVKYCKSQRRLLILNNAITVKI